MRCDTCGDEQLSDARFCGACGAALVADRGPEGDETRTVGAYRLVGLVGTGATGAVYLAYDATATRCAVKELHAGLADDRYLERLRREAQVLAGLHHPNVVGYLDYVEAEGTAYVATEYVDGSSLREVERRAGALSPEQALGVLSGCLAGLEAAHRSGIVHGDLKPENILVDAHGTSKLADFGQVVVEGSRSTFGGTPAYMSPEAARGQAIDHRSDLYSMGVVLYEALAARLPFVADSDLAVLRMQANDDPAPIEGLAPRVDLLVRTALAKDPEVRPASAAAFKEELDAAAASSYGSDWLARSSVAAAAAALAGGLGAAGAGSASAAAAPPAQVTAATTTSGGATTAVHALASPVRAGRSSRLASSKLGGLLGSHPIVSAVVSVVLVAGAATGGVLVARDHAAPPATLTSHWSLATETGFGMGVVGVSCDTTTSCQAASGYSEGFDGSELESFDGSVWRLAYEDTTYRCGDCLGAALSSVQCPSPTQCHAVDNQGDFLSYDGTSWTSTFVNPDHYWGALSCPTATFCVAGDADGNVWTYDSGSWTGPTNISAGVEAQPFSSTAFPDGISQVSCPPGQTTFCVAVDNSGYAMTYDGTTWSTPVSIDAGYLVEVSCASTTLCVASDSSGGVVTYDGSTWTPLALGTGSVEASCASSAFCVAGDSLGDVYYYRDGSWSERPVALDPGSAITAVSCSSAVCAVGDVEGRVFILSPITGGTAPSTIATPASAMGSPPMTTTTQATTSTTRSAGSEAGSMTALLTASSVERDELQRAVDAMQAAVGRGRCVPGAAAAAADLGRVANARQDLLDRLARTALSSVPRGGVVRADLRHAWLLSERIDRSFRSWAVLELHRGCRVGDPDVPAYDAAQVLDPQATASKTTFVDAWDPIAAGLSQPAGWTPGQL